jgi:hypothetical protein
MQDQHRDGRVGQHGGGHAAEQVADQPVVAVGADHDQPRVVRPVGGGRSQYRDWLKPFARDEYPRFVA